jgi:hypothetical protein
MAGTDANDSTPRPISPISPTDALKSVLSRDPNRSIHDVAQDLTEWIRRNRCRLWCNDNLVPPHFTATSLIMVARTEADGRPRVDVVPAGGVGWAGSQKTFTFELDADDVRALLSPSKQHGPKAVKKTKRQPQSDRARWALRRMFPDGQIPAELSTSTLERKIIGELTGEAGKKAKMDSVPFPSWDVVDDVRQEPLSP